LPLCGAVDMPTIIRALLVTVLFGAGLLTGSVVSHLEVFPSQLLSPVVTRISTAYMKATNPESYALLSQSLDEATNTLTTNEGKTNRTKTFQSKYFDIPLTVPTSVFWPQEAEGEMLPIMGRNAHLFEGKRVLEIGTGTGIVSLNAARLGASKVVSTDISPEAVAAARNNAEAMGFDDVMEVRLVPEDDISAFSALRADEQFDIIISNPPYALDLDAPANTAVVDRGDLGFSIVRGLDQHLAADGSAILFYGSAFYHDVMVKFARYSGFNVRNHASVGLFPWEAETLFNSYLKRLLEVEGMDTKSFSFNYKTDQSLRNDFLKNTAISASSGRKGRLFADEKGWFWYPGMMVIRHPEN
jgi:methylase of polypeptide subunit release factors